MEKTLLLVNRLTRARPQGGHVVLVWYLVLRSSSHYVVFAAVKCGMATPHL